MKYTTYSRYVPGLLETLNLQALLDQLADFLLQSGFAGGPYSHPLWGEFGEEDPDRSLDALRQAILQALMDSGQLTPDMLNVLRGESTGDTQKDQEDRKSTRLNSSHPSISYAVFCLKKKIKYRVANRHAGTRMH